MGFSRQFAEHADKKMIEGALTPVPNVGPHRHGQERDQCCKAGPHTVLARRVTAAGVGRGKEEK